LLRIRNDVEHAVYSIKCLLRLRNSRRVSSSTVEFRIRALDEFRQRGELWRLIASMFLHGGWLHWLANSWALYQLGTLYEVLFGSKRFALIYFSTGIIAGLASSMYNHGPAVGASGAIFGILGAFIFSIRRSPVYRHQPWTRGLIGQLVFWIVVNIAIGYSLPFIDNVAHMGGLISGLLMGLIPHRVPPPPPRDSVIDVGTFDQPAQ